MRERKKKPFRGRYKHPISFTEAFLGGRHAAPPTGTGKKILILFFSQVLHERGKGQLSLVALISQGGASFNFR